MSELIPLRKPFAIGNFDVWQKADIDADFWGFVKQTEEPEEREEREQKKQEINQGIKTQPDGMHASVGQMEVTAEPIDDELPHVDSEDVVSEDVDSEDIDLEFAAAQKLKLPYQKEQAKNEWISEAQNDEEKLLLEKSLAKEQQFNKEYDPSTKVFTKDNYDILSKALNADHRDIYLRRRVLIDMGKIPDKDINDRDKIQKIWGETFTGDRHNDIDIARTAMVHHINEQMINNAYYTNFETYKKRMTSGFTEEDWPTTFWETFDAKDSQKNYDGRSNECTSNRVQF